MEVRTVGVIGAGQMGSGIAQLVATSGVHVWIQDSDQGALDRSSLTIAAGIGRLVSKAQLSQSAGADALSRLKFTKKLGDLRSADLIIEAIVESEDEKRKLFQELDKMTKKSAILASNTSSISITRLASATSRSSQVIGLHFMNPPPVMKLMEIIRGANTSEETFVIAKCFSERIGKIVVCSKDYPGFIVNRILMVMINEAFFTLYTGVATKEDIDAGIKLGANHPMGPLSLADFIGLDVCLSVMKVIHEGLGDNKYSPCPLLVQYVDAGRLGKKSGKGVYTYSNDAEDDDGLATCLASQILDFDQGKLVNLDEVLRSSYVYSYWDSHGSTDPWDKMSTTMKGPRRQGQQRELPSIHHRRPLCSTRKHPLPSTSTMWWLAILRGPGPPCIPTSILIITSSTPSCFPIPTPLPMSETALFPSPWKNPHSRLHPVLYEGDTRQTRSPDSAMPSRIQPGGNLWREWSLHGHGTRVLPCHQRATGNHGL